MGRRHTHVAGVDTGRDGALVIIDEAEQIQSIVRLGDLIYKPRAHTQIVLDALDRYCPTVIGLERVNSSPGQGVSSAFQQGHAYGVLQGILQAWCLTDVNYGKLTLVESSGWHKLAGGGTKPDAWYAALGRQPEVFRDLRPARDQGIADAYFIALAAKNLAYPTELE